MPDDDMDILNDIGDPDNSGDQGTGDSADKPVDETPEDDDEVEDEGEEDEGDDDAEDEEAEEAPEGEGDAEKKPRADPAIEGRPTYQELKKADPEIFKKVPGLKDIFFREQKFSETFASVEEAVTAAKKADDFDIIEASLMQGDPSLVLRELAANSPESVPQLVDNFLPTLQRMSKDLYVRATMPVLQDLIRMTYNDGKRLNDKNLMYAAGHIAKHVFGEARIPEPRIQSTGPHPAEVQLREERSRHFNERYGSFNQELASESYTRLERIADRGITDPENKLNGFTRKAITKEALAELDEKLGEDQQLANTLRQLWRRATVGGFTKEHKEAILNAHLSRAKQLLPGIRNRMVAEALGQKVAGKNNHKQKRDIPSGGRGAAGGVRGNAARLDPKKIDWGKTSDEDLLAGKITTRK
jgi:hypothetical protein